MNNLISIITPTYNSENFIEDTIMSIQGQSYKNWELLITDDNSNDNTWSVICEKSRNDRRIKVFRLNDNSGAGIARNNSITHAQGRYIAFCDSDDQWAPKKLEKQIQFMKEKDCALSFSSYYIIDEKGKPQGKVLAKSEVNYNTMLRNNYIGCLTAMYDTKKLGKIYMPKIRKRQDWALWLSILKKTDNAYGIREPLAIYRNRSNSISTKKVDLIKYNWNIYRKVEEFSSLKATFYLLQFFIYYLKKKL